MAAQPKITDLIPSKPLTLVLLFLAGALVIAGLETLYYWMPQFAALATDGRIAAFDLDSEGSLGAWFSSLLLLASGLVCLLIWSLRRHRLDDYHGRYRVWFWAAGVWFVMSIDEACSLHEGFKELMAHATGQRLMGDGSLWWIMAYGLVLGTLGIRLLLEMRPCRTSTSFFVLTGLIWAAAIVWQLGLVMPGSGARGVMVEEGCEMLGDLVLLLGLAIHARYVLLEVQGLLPERSRRKKVKREKAASAEPASAESTSAKERPAASIVASSSTRPAAASTRPGGVQTRVDPPQNPLESRRLSKAERRAQRRLARERDEA
jgi:hypothetical protein